MPKTTTPQRKSLKAPHTQNDIDFNALTNRALIINDLSRSLDAQKENPRAFYDQLNVLFEYDSTFLFDVLKNTTDSFSSVQVDILLRQFLENRPIHFADICAFILDRLSANTPIMVFEAITDLNPNKKVKESFDVFSKKTPNHPCSQLYLATLTIQNELPTIPPIGKFFEGNKKELALKRTLSLLRNRLAYFSGEELLEITRLRYSTDTDKELKETLRFLFAKIEFPLLSKNQRIEMSYKFSEENGFEFKLKKELIPNAVAVDPTCCVCTAM